MNKTPIVIADSDAIIARANPTDSNHQIAIKISQKLIKIGAKVIYPSCVIFECTTTMSRKLNNPKMTAGTLAIFSNPTMIIEPIDREIIALAAKYFNPKATKKNTPFDCAVAAVAEKYKADYIFSFDEFYKKQGFALAKEVLEDFKGI